MTILHQVFCTLFQSYRFQWDLLLFFVVVADVVVKQVVIVFVVAVAVVVVVVVLVVVVVVIVLIIRSLVNGYFIVYGLSLIISINRISFNCVAQPIKILLIYARKTM
jgi:hypothetical protein